ncbi:hypothetical protein [Fusobacterium necrophorum]|uniref:hypothetical protein n=1 Tax=Fusobacterium necrophorum TaxID=859 RepID=UPI0021C33E3D|nr:hypothetical protein [Fusobacterium necrophorum]
MQFFKILTAMSLCYVTANADVGKENVEKQETEKLIVKKGVIYEKYEKAKQESKESALFGKFAISGNAIVFSKSKSLENNGQLYGFLEAKGDRVFDNTLEGAVVTDGEGNGVASTAFSSFANKKREIDRKIPELVNRGMISGGADLQGGEAEVHGFVEGTATGNGVVLYGLADYGVILGSDGAGGSIGNDGKSDGRAGASAGGGIHNSTGGGNPYNPEDPFPKIEKSDLIGKNVVVTLEKLENDSQISGAIYAKTSDGYIREKSTEMNGMRVEEHIQPQWRSILLAASGNGVATHTFVSSPTKQNFSTESQNKAKIGEIHNSGEIKGKGEFAVGNMATINYTNSFAVANGISLSAYSANNVGHQTETEIKEVDNHGKISGNLKQRAGENTGSGWHEYSDAIAVASGNGQIINSSKSSGNGIALYALGGQQGDTSIDSISNKGMITGKAVIYGGKDTAAAYSGRKEKRFHVEIRRNSSLSSWLSSNNSVSPFTEEEKKKGTEVFEKKREAENRKLDSKLEEFKEILQNSEAKYLKLKEKMTKKEELLKKASGSYIEKLEREVKEIEKKLRKKINLRNGNEIITIVKFNNGNKKLKRKGNKKIIVKSLNGIRLKSKNY